MFHIINWSTIVFAFGTFVLEDQKFYPDWLHILLMFLILIADYFLYIHNGYYKKLIQEDIITKNETRKLDYLLVFYIILTFVALGYTIFKSREFFA